MYFYPPGYLRERQLDTVRNWPRELIVNRSFADVRAGELVSRETSLAERAQISWKQHLPLINVKCRPKALPKDVVTYLWGGVTVAGPFITDLDNPYALTGYNIRAMALYRSVLRRILRGHRCVEIRCLSRACKKTLGLLFGGAVEQRAAVHYPYIRRRPNEIAGSAARDCRFLFVGTQFEIKGGAALLRAFRRVYAEEPMARLDLITHLPAEYREMAESCPAITVHEARFLREEIFDQFMAKADVLVHPTYIESFGMVVLEALAHGLAVITTDVYALKEMVVSGVNGYLLVPPISIWDGYLPSKYYYDWPRFKDHVRRVDTSVFEESLVEAMLELARNPERRMKTRQASVELLNREFLNVSA